MLHELVFALYGNHGSVFVLKGGHFKVNCSLPFLHPSEATIVNHLLEIASDYWRLQSFIKKYRNSSPQNGLHGLYIESLCDGLDCVLESYRDSIRDLEKTVLKEQDGNLQISYFHHVLAPHASVLTALNNLIHHVEIRKVHGCYLLDIIYKASCSGYDRVQRAMKRLLHEGHKVMYKQLLAWLLQGTLYDPSDEFFIVENKAKENSTSSSSPQKLFSANDDEIRHESKSYKLRVESIPSYISLQIAEKIFFVGESVQLFELDRRIELQGSVLKERETEFYQKLSQLRECNEFQVSDFERFIDGIRETASKHLHSLVLTRSDLRQEVVTMRDFFLMARGELFQTFIQIADKYLRHPASATTQHDVGQAFMNAIRATHQDDDAILKRIKMVVNGRSGVSGWSCLSMAYLVPWPLHLIFTTSALEQYDKIFQFLILVKRTQLKLHESWAEEMMSRKTSRYWQLRSHMTFIVDNLQHYLMADVLESQFSILSAALDNSSNFEDLKDAHNEFLSSVSTLIFVNNKPVYECVVELLFTCLTFSESVLLNTLTENQYDTVSSKFSRHSSLLFQILSSLHNHHSHLAQLLLRIDFNRYFSTHGHSLKE